MAHSFKAAPTNSNSDISRTEYLRTTLLDGGISQLAEVSFHVGNTARPGTSIKDLESHEKDDLNDATKFIEGCVRELFNKHLTPQNQQYMAKDEVATLRFQLSEKDKQIRTYQQELSETQKTLVKMEIELRQTKLDKGLRDQVYRLMNAQRNVGVKKIKEFLAVWKAAGGYDFTLQELADFEAFLKSCDAFVQHQNS